jgi:hypothetical protein
MKTRQAKKRGSATGDYTRHGSSQHSCSSCFANNTFLYGFLLICQRLTPQHMPLHYQSCAIRLLQKSPLYATRRPSLTSISDGGKKRNETALPLALPKAISTQFRPQYISYIRQFLKLTYSFSLLSRGFTIRYVCPLLFAYFPRSCLASNLPQRP